MAGSLAYRSLPGQAWAANVLPSCNGSAEWVTRSSICRRRKPLLTLPAPSTGRKTLFTRAVAFWPTAVGIHSRAPTQTAFFGRSETCDHSTSACDCRNYRVSELYIGFLPGSTRPDESDRHLVGGLLGAQKGPLANTPERICLCRIGRASASDLRLQHRRSCRRGVPLGFTTDIRLPCASQRKRNNSHCWDSPQRSRRSRYCDVARRLLGRIYR